ncbi:MAG TPA: hypothetical protein PKC82_01740 [Chitinophagaceae bacterium]|nr:hypothetical protein [Chitinophagaceae bacterium]HNA90976.1 hypothetical protein [Chitinophagaceae bacterium]
MKKILFSVVLFTTLLVSNHAFACDKCGKEDPKTQLYGAMQKLWNEHMQWTFATVDAFFHNPKGLDAQLNRLLQNQKDIGNAIIPFYGEAAGKQLSQLLTVHIQEAVPVLTAAKNNDQPGLKKALDDWYVNAQEIADFLAKANANWKQEDLRQMMKAHIDQTTAYAVDLLKNDYTNAITKFDEASGHMNMMSAALAAGIIKQFPDKFKTSKKLKNIILNQIKNTDYDYYKHFVEKNRNHPEIIQHRFSIVYFFAKL